MSIEYDAAKTLLDKGIKVEVTSPLWLRAFGKRTVTLAIRQPFLGTLYRISALYLGMCIEEADLENMEGAHLHLLFKTHGRTLAAIAAQGILNGKWSGKVFGRMLARSLFWRLTPLQLLMIARVMVSVSGTTAFMNTIRLIGSMKMTAPNLSQEDQGS